MCNEIVIKLFPFVNTANLFHRPSTDQLKVVSSAIDNTKKAKRDLEATWIVESVQDVAEIAKKDPETSSIAECVQDVAKDN